MPEYSTAYLAAWHRFMGKGMDFAQITKRDIAALSTHPETKLWYEQWRREEDKKQERAAKEEAARRPAPAPAPSQGELVIKRLGVLFREAEVKEKNGEHADFFAIVKQASDEYPAAPAPMFLVHLAFDALEQTRDKNKERNEKIAALEARVKELEAAPKSLVYKGIWSSEDAYDIGAVVTERGSMWTKVAVTDRRGRPGESRDWVLCVKRGSDGKDAGR